MSLSASSVIPAALRALHCFVFTTLIEMLQFWGNVIGNKNIGIIIVIMHLSTEYPFFVFSAFTFHSINNIVFPKIVQFHLEISTFLFWSLNKKYIFSLVRDVLFMFVFHLLVHFFC